MGHETGADRLCLRLPALVTHHITPDSALAHWNEPGGILQDADSEIVVVVRLCPRFDRLLAQLPSATVCAPNAQPVMLLAALQN